MFTILVKRVSTFKQSTAEAEGNAISFENIFINQSSDCYIGDLMMTLDEKSGDHPPLN